MNDMAIIKCPICKKEFYCRPSRIKSSKSGVVYCSKKCFSEYRRNLRPEAFRTCINCGKNFRTNPAYIARRKNKNNCNFCSVGCFREYRSKYPEKIFGERKLGSWENMSVCEDNHGYLVCSRGRIHRLIMEKHLGRKLLRGEVVHHIDGNSKNNSINNLQVMTHSEHSSLHGKEKPKTGVSSKCIDCGKELYLIKSRVEEFYNGSPEEVHKRARCQKCYYKTKRWIKYGKKKK